LKCRPAKSEDFTTRQAFFWIYSERKRPHDLLGYGLSKNSPEQGQGAQLYPRIAARQRFFHLFFTPAPAPAILAFLPQNQ